MNIHTYIIDEKKKNSQLDQTHPEMFHSIV